MKKLIFIALMLTLATACNRGFEEVRTVPGPAGAPGAPGRDAPVTTLSTQLYLH